MIYQENYKMLNCLDELTLSTTHSENRLNKAYSLLGENLVNKIIGFTLFLLGASRKQVAEKINTPIGTFLSFLTRIDNIGIAAFEDRRSSTSFQVKQAKSQQLTISLKKEKNDFNILFNNDNNMINLPINNSLQSKVVLLTFLKNGLLSLKEVSQALNFSTVHTRQLCTKLHNDDVHSLIDKRKGQLKDHTYTADIKAEIIKKFTVNAITGNSISSQSIANQLNDENNLKLYDLSVRWHIQKLGLHKIAKSLSIDVSNLKKNSKI